VKLILLINSWFFGRGVLLSVLIETMRREGYELQIGQPQGYHQIDGKNVSQLRN
jgi:predicted membrane GTPase involved in stress response